MNYFATLALLALASTVYADKLEFKHCDGNYKYKAKGLETSDLVLGEPCLVTLQGDFDADLNEKTVLEVKKFLGPTLISTERFNYCEVETSHCKTKTPGSATVELPVPKSTPPMVTVAIEATAYGSDGTPLVCVKSAIKFKAPKA